MNPQDLLVLAALVFAAALLYSMVGHAGASGYLAAMALCGVSAAVMKPTALVLNLIVATVASIQFARARCFAWDRFWPFAIGSVPLAFVGGGLVLPGAVYRRLVGLVLLFAAWRLFRHARLSAASAPVPVWLWAALPLGGAIGLLSGLTGVGGGIFLSPLLLLTRWADARTTAGVSAVFILVNSAAGLLGHAASVRLLPAGLPALAGAALAGGLLGSTLGSRRLPNVTLRRLLALVLVVAAVKMIFVRA
jgi:uncharacterized membrane protein YfcA